MPGKDFVVGLDLGQAHDYTALVALEKVPAEDGSTELQARHIERCQLNTPYPAIVSRVVALLATDELKGAQLVVDATGVGRAVVDLFRAAGLKLVAVTVTGGDVETRGEDGGRRVPKRDLIGSAQVALQEARLKIAAGLPEATNLVSEMLSYRVTINTATGHDSYSPWREGQHDDLVFALALAVWFAASHKKAPRVSPAGMTRPSTWKVGT